MEFPIATAAVHAQLDELGLEIYPAKRQAEDCEGSSPCKKQIALNAADIDSHNDMGPSRSPVRTSDDVPDFNVQDESSRDGMPLATDAGNSSPAPAPSVPASAALQIVPLAISDLSTEPVPENKTTTPQPSNNASAAAAAAAASPEVQVPNSAEPQPTTAAESDLGEVVSQPTPVRADGDSGLASLPPTTTTTTTDVLSAPTSTIALAKLDSFVTPQNAVAAPGHLQAPPRLPGTVVSSVSSAEDRIPAAPQCSPATQELIFSPAESVIAHSGDSSDEDDQAAEFTLVNWNVEVLGHGQMATVCRDPRRHIIEKRVTMFDQNGMPITNFAAKVDLLHKEHTVYLSVGEHPYIVRVLDFVEEVGYCVIVMEDLVEQRYEPLIQVIEAGPTFLTDRDIAKIIRGVCEALASIHAAEILHGDLSVNNVMVKRAPTGEVISCKLVDFNGFVDLKNWRAGARDWVGAESVSAPETDIPDLLGRQLLFPYPADYTRPDHITTAADMWSIGRLIWMMAMRTLHITNDLRARELRLDQLPADSGSLLAFDDSDGKQAGPLMRLQHALVSLDASARPSCHDVLDRLDEMRLF